MRHRRTQTLLGSLLVALPTLAVAVAVAPAPVSAAASAPLPDLHLVTLEGPGTAGDRSNVPTVLRTLQMRATQQDVLRSVDAGTPTYVWTHALNGFAVELDEDQAQALVADPRVSLVEPNSVRPLSAVASLSTASSAPLASAAPGARDRGGAGTVIGMIDSGLAPEGPVFADVPGLGRRPVDFRGECEAGDPSADWDRGTCDEKLVSARWFVQGFGEDRLRSSSSLSPRDTDGHGTQMASIAAGNSNVSVLVGDQRLDSFSGAAPQSRLAVYKACWTAPDPDDDGCATADLVSAVDRAVQDRVDVVNLSVGGAAEFDTVERALLGAAEADIVVTAAAGNAGSSQYGAHPGPWVTTVGGTEVTERRGRVVVQGGGSFEGAMSSTDVLPVAPIVLSSDAPAAGATQDEARTCSTGSLSAASVSGRIVVCERGAVGRIDKSATVELAGGVGMILVNPAAGSVDADLHRVPTVHLDAASGRDLLAAIDAGDAARASLRPLGEVRGSPVVPAWSAAGDPQGGVVKPDVVAPANGVLGAVPAGVGDVPWDFVSGTSAASAQTAGVAARLIARRDFDAVQVRSALATTAAPLADTSPLRSGAGLLKPSRVETPGLAYELDPTDYRAWLEGRRTELNTPSILMSGSSTQATRTVTNLGNQALFFSSRAVGFRQQVRVTPAALRLAPGESADFTVTTQSPGQPVARLSDDGYVVWRGARGTTTRIPVLITR